MLILALDTSATTATVALLEDGVSVGAFHIYNKLTHSEKLLPMIDSLLTFVKKTIDDINLIAVSSGPGSFTGVRIGVSCVKGLALSRDIPIASVSTLEALANNFLLFAPKKMKRVIICPCMDARRDELYSAIFSFDGEKVERLSGDMAVSCQDLSSKLSEYDASVYLLGDGGEKMYKFLDEEKPAFKFYSVPTVMCMQNAQSVGMVGYKKFLQNETVTAEKLVCTYLRQSQAERNYKGE